MKKLIISIFYLTLAIITVNLSSCAPRAAVVVSPAPTKKVVVVKKRPVTKRVVVVRRY